jgi:hypothetical protein
MAIDSYTLKELQALTDVPAGTLRDWVQRKFLPRPTGRGRGSRYGYSAGPLEGTGTAARGRRDLQSLRHCRFALARSELEACAIRFEQEIFPAQPGDAAQ